MAWSLVSHSGCFKEQFLKRVVLQNPREGNVGGLNHWSRVLGSGFRVSGLGF